MPQAYPVSPNMIGRLSLYRRILERSREALGDQSFIFSHELAELSGYKAALVRRDLMTIGFSGNPKKGYEIARLVESIGRFLDPPRRPRAVLVGTGNLGRALLSYFSKPSGRLRFVAAFDKDPALAGTELLGCPVFAPEEMQARIKRRRIRIAVIAIPPQEAQDCADALLRAGITGILNFSPTFLRTPEGVYVHNIDMTMSLEQVAYFSR